MRQHRCLILLAVAVATASLSSSAMATAISFEGTDNATIQVAGPRPGANGRAFFNMESNSNGNFASYGVIDFVPPFNGTVTAVNSASLLLTQSNAAFSQPGTFGVYLTNQTGVTIADGSNTVTYTPGPNGTGNVDTDLLPLTFLGTGTFTNVANGTVDSAALTFTGPALATLINSLNTGAPLRLVTVVNADPTAATYAGVTNSTLAGPTLSLDVTAVPEPTSSMLLMLGITVLTFARRRR